MKQSIFVLILALAMANPVSAQDESGSPEQSIERMRINLGLSDEQVSAMLRIQNSNASQQDKRNMMHELLTPEQRKRMQARRQRQAGEAHNRQNMAKDEDGDKDDE